MYVDRLNVNPFFGENDCGIAKGSLYKFFASKEDLLIEVYDSRVQRMYDQAETIKTDESLSSRDRFIRESLQYVGGGF